LEEHDQEGGSQGFLEGDICESQSDFPGQTESEMLMGMESGRELDAMEDFEGEEGESMGSPDPNVHLDEGEEMDEMGSQVEQEEGDHHDEEEDEEEGDEDEEDAIDITNPEDLARRGLQRI
jgi:hypothetical protein